MGIAFFAGTPVETSLPSVTFDERRLRGGRWLGSGGFWRRLRFWLLLPVLFIIHGFFPFLIFDSLRLIFLKAGLRCNGWWFAFLSFGFGGEPRKEEIWINLEFGIQIFADEFQVSIEADRDSPGNRWPERSAQFISQFLCSLAAEMLLTKRVVSCHKAFGANGSPAG